MSEKTLELAIIYYSTFGHVAKLAAAIQQGALRVLVSRKD